MRNSLPMPQMGGNSFALSAGTAVLRGMHFAGVFPPLPVKMPADPRSYGRTSGAGGGRGQSRRASQVGAVGTLAAGVAAAAYQGAQNILQTGTIHGAGASACSTRQRTGPAPGQRCGSVVGGRAAQRSAYRSSYQSKFVASQTFSKTGRSGYRRPRQTSKRGRSVKRRY